MPPVGFETTISAGERPQTYALDREATGTGTVWRLQEEKILSTARPNLQNNPYMTLLLNHADNTASDSISVEHYAC